MTVLIRNETDRNVSVLSKQSRILFPAQTTLELTSDELKEVSTATNTLLEKGVLKILTDTKTVLLEEAPEKTTPKKTTSKKTTPKEE